VHKTHYTLAKEASICSGKLFDDFGYIPNTPALKAVLDGTYPPTVEFSYGNKGAVQQNFSHKEDNTKRFCQPSNHTSAMEMVLGHCQQGDILL
jgi:hypothetical protein